MTFKTVDLCAGIGGIRKGFELTGHFENVLSAEVDPLACKTYELLFGENPLNDIKSDAFKQKIRETPYDVLLAGFPCQAFSRVGLRRGFKDQNKGTVFFDIYEIIEQTKPKVVFLENVENLVTHDKGNTFKTIIESLELELGYSVIGVANSDNGTLRYKAKDFIRNTKNFGLPQNRPRVYIIAFSRAHFGGLADAIETRMPDSDDKVIFESVFDVLERDVPARFFLSSGYLETLEKHAARQKAKGYGFGYRILNSEGVEKPIANTLLATGGSGRERNLVIDTVNGAKYAGQNVQGKYSPINAKNVRTMTPAEWGRLQGFIGYAFVDKDGIDRFAFPEDLTNVQRYKQIGNSVSIPVIEAMAKYIYCRLKDMTEKLSPVDLRLLTLYGETFNVCKAISCALFGHAREGTIIRYMDMVEHFGCEKPVRNRELSEYLGFTTARTSQILGQLSEIGCIKRREDRSIVFTTRV